MFVITAEAKDIRASKIPIDHTVYTYLKHRSHLTAKMTSWHILMEEVPAYVVIQLLHYNIATISTLVIQKYEVPAMGRARSHPMDPWKDSHVME